jgi:hypothetical protein
VYPYPSSYCLRCSAINVSQFTWSKNALIYQFPERTSANAAIRRSILQGMFWLCGGTGLRAHATFILHDHVVNFSNLYYGLGFTDKSSDVPDHLRKVVDLEAWRRRSPSGAHQL